MGIAAVGAVGVFYAAFRYVDDVRTQLGPTVEVLQLVQDVDAYTRIPNNAVRPAEIPARYAPANRVARGDLGGLVAVGDLPAGAVLQAGMLTPPPEIEAGQREIAIVVNDETAVAGKIRPGSTVDVFATFDAVDDVPPTSRVVLENIRVVAVGNPVTTPNPDQAFDEDTGVPVTFALEPRQGQILTYVESFATSVRLALRTPGAADTLEPGSEVYSPDDLTPGNATAPSDDQFGTTEAATEGTTRVGGEE